ncbi:MAG: creatininase family protein [Acidobacteriota bacterium]|nr:creatininase family protein [Acidobacteriota bacterium]
MKQILLVAIFFILSCQTANAQIFRVAQMNTEQIKALDKQKTVVILTGGILEQHGPHLPTFTDGYSNEWLAQKLAEAIVERPGSSVLMFPTIPLGHEGANEIGAQFVFPGTYSIRRSTLRAIFMDLGTEFGEQGFKWVFVVHGHGAPFHNLMLDEAGEYFRDSYGGRMVNLFGLMPNKDQLAALNLPPQPDKSVVAEERREIGNIDVHAGFDETSRLMFLRPDLAGANVKQLPPLTTDDFAEFFKVARTPGWLGYHSSPRLANASYGALAMKYRSQQHNALALAILDGKLDERNIPRYAKIMTGNPQVKSSLEPSTKNEIERERKQREWLKKKGIE